MYIWVIYKYLVHKTLTQTPATSFWFYGANSKENEVVCCHFSCDGSMWEPNGLDTTTEHHSGGVQPHCLLLLWQLDEWISKGVDTIFSPIDLLPPPGVTWSQIACYLWYVTQTSSTLKTSSNMSRLIATTCCFGMVNNFVVKCRGSVDVSKLSPTFDKSHHYYHIQHEIHSSSGYNRVL